jgi:60 kDa SS-A/Ro ribonucleoprotein
MSKFNTTLPKQKTLTENLAGGQSYSQSIEMSLVSLLLTSFVNDQFYRGAQTTLQELKKLSEKVKDKEFVAKSAIYARDKFGMRSVTHALAAELTSQLNGAEWGKDFYNKVVIRVDDMTEILSYYLAYKTEKDNPKFPNSLKKGFAKAFDKFDGYQLAKYKGENKEVKLVDIVNLVHPVPTSRNKEALELLVKGELKNTETWEAKLSKVGQLADSEEELTDLKSNAWSELISSRKLGYFALLRNLRNIIIQSPTSVKAACEMLVDEKLIKSSRVLPFRFATAYDEINKIAHSKEVRDVLVAINQALEVSIQNVPKFDGETLVVMDVSGSMMGRASEIASLFGAVLAKSNNCDVMTFATNADYKSYNPTDSVMSIRNSFKYSGGGTNFKSIFQKANKKYDRVVILSDMQGWIGYTSPVSDFKSYKNKFGANPFIYSWDLAGYGTLQLPENNVFCLAGFSDKVFDVMKLMEIDKNALYDEIKSVQLV